MASRNTHGKAGLFAEFRAHLADFQDGYVISGGMHPASGSTSVSMPATAACIRSDDAPAEARYTEEKGARTITYSGGDGTYWLIMHPSVVETVGGWTRVQGTHYLWQRNASQPATPVGAILLCRATVILAAIDEVIDYRVRLINQPVTEPFSYSTDKSAYWKFLRGGTMTFDGVTVNHFGEIEAGEYQIFADEGIAFPEGATVKASWFGARPGQESAAAIIRAANCSDARIEVTFQSGTYLIEETVTMPSGTERDMALIGQGARRTIFQPAAGFEDILFLLGDLATPTTPTRILELGGFAIDGLDKTTAGIVGLRMLRTGESHVHDLYVSRCETALWFSGGSHQWLDRVRITGNNAGLIVDNNVVDDDLAPTLFTLRDSWVNNNDQGVWINGESADDRLSRSFVFDRVQIENGAITTGTDVGLKITMADQVHFNESWIERCTQHVIIQGADGVNDDGALEVTRFAAHCTFNNCNFGIQNASAPVDTPVFVFDGIGPRDGDACIIGYSRMNEGEFQFNQRVKVKLEHNTFLGDSFPSGNYEDVRSDDVNNEVIMLDTAVANWRMSKVVNTDGVNECERHDILTRAATTDDTETTLAQHTVPEDSSLSGQVDVIARADDNSAQGRWSFIFLAKRDSGNATLIGGKLIVLDGALVGGTGVVSGMDLAGAVTAAVGIENNSSLACTIDQATDKVRVRGTGLAATPMTWYINWSLLQIAEV